MSIWFRMIFLGLLAIGLSGCILETKKPLFADSDAKPLLADYPNLSYYERNNGIWAKTKEPVVFRPQASHYLMKPEPDDPEIQVSFVTIEGLWWVLQAVEAAETSYVLVKAEPKELLVYPLECKVLKESGKFEHDIEFKDSDCSVKEGADKTALFKALIGNASEPSSKLVSEP
jgi:hypothetical protein